jgi:hypothetical protein
VVGPKVAVVDVVTEHVIRGGEHGGGHGDDGLAGPSAAAQAKELGAELAGLNPSYRL